MDLEEWAKLSPDRRAKYRRKLVESGVRLRPLSRLVGMARVRLYDEFAGVIGFHDVSEHEPDENGWECLKVTVKPDEFQGEVPARFAGFNVYKRSVGDAVEVYARTAKAVAEGIILSCENSPKNRIGLKYYQERAAKVPGLLFYEGPFILLDDMIREMAPRFRSKSAWMKERRYIHNMIFGKDDDYIRHPDLFKEFPWDNVKATVWSFLSE